MQRRLLRCLFAICVLSAGAALAHHSRAPYDMTREIVIEGTITDLEWRNPHISMTVETDGADGEADRVEIEVMSVSEASALGLRKEAIAPGARVVIRAHPGRNNSARAVGLDVRAADGVVYPLNVDARAAVGAVAVPASGVAGHWAPTVESFSALGAASRAWPRTEAARAALAERARSTNGAMLGICEPFPPPVLSMFPDLRTIEVNETSVVMRFQGAVGVNMERVVHLDQQAHPADVAPSLMGHSIGRWEGEALVIDTVAFSPHPVGGWFAPSGPSKHLVERLALTADRLELEYSFTLEDSAAFTAPVSHTATWQHRPDLALSNEACDPEVARRHLQ